MKKFLILLMLFSCGYSLRTNAQAAKQPRFRVLAFYENGGHHVAYSARAVQWLDQLAADSNFAIDYRQNTNDFTTDFLEQYQLLIQLDFVPYAWKDEAKQAFRQYI